MKAGNASRMRASLAGLSVGDAFGERFFRAGVARRHLAGRSLPRGTWRWTDDTNMACSITEVLMRHGTIDREALASSFGRRFDPSRGYGRAMYGLLPRYAAGSDWRSAAPGLFAGEGSFGNGAAMRVAPLGAFFADDLDRVVDEATRSAEVTHAHPDGKAGAVAVAVAAAVAAGDSPPAGPAAFAEPVIAHAPPGPVRDRLLRIQNLGPSAPATDAVALLGNGSHISAEDTVAFCVWAASRHLDDYPGALWTTAGAGGDVDTTCAIVGGIVAAHTGTDGVPAEWLQHREPLPAWVLLD